MIKVGGTGVEDVLFWKGGGARLLLVGVVGVVGGPAPPLPLRLFRPVPVLDEFALVFAFASFP